MRALIPFVAMTLIGAAPPPSKEVQAAIGAVLQADSGRALSLLNGVDVASLLPKDQATVLCMRERLTQSPPTAAPSSGITDRALAVYRTYWLAAMARPQDRQLEEQRLAASLRSLLGAPGTTDLDALEPILAQAIEKDGFHSLEGQTGLLRELMVWARQDERVMRVPLPDGEYRVKVEFLNDFRSFGWSNYASCGRASTGGWATDTALFAVVPRYASLDDEEFRVSFLGHETQHFADKARFKDLASWELEYRAKLTELAQANTTRVKLIKRFIQDQGDDPASPHSYANRRVLMEMMGRLRLSSPDALIDAEVAAVQAAAVALLREDTRRRTAAKRSS